jgi:hypothetical protein
MEQCMMRKKTTVPIWFEPTSDSPLPVSPTLSHIRKDRCVGACGAVYCLKRCTCMSDLRSQKRPIHLLCMMHPNAMVPIQFELKLEGHWPIAHMSHPLQDCYIGACEAVYLPQALYLHARCSIMVKSRSSVLLAPSGYWLAGCCLRQYILASLPSAVQLWLTRVRPSLVGNWGFDSGFCALSASRVAVRWAHRAGVFLGRPVGCHAWSDFWRSLDLQSVI